MEPIDEWTVAELKAELKDLGLSNSGNKEELYERLLDAEEEDWGDEEDGFDRSELMASLAGAVVSNRVAIGAVVAVVMLVVAVVVAGPSVLEMIIPAKEAEPEVSVWEFTIEERNQTDIQTF
ncbi:MAG: SAP domain-containing protein, partial [Candidatus Poseidoniales archaeon]|nr:SAP domain-containing protein [Candidatus Poseidoniales archaeon]